LQLKGKEWKRRICEVVVEGGQKKLKAFRDPPSHRMARTQPTQVGGWAPGVEKREV
jgi:hypothetical protein